MKITIGTPAWNAMSELKTLLRNAEYAKQRDTVRPYRLWDAKEKRNLRWRCYANKRNALIGALIETAMLDIGKTVEVYDCRYQTLQGQFTKRVKHVDIFIPNSKGDQDAEGRLPAQTQKRKAKARR